MPVCIPARFPRLILPALSLAFAGGRGQGMPFNRGGVAAPRRFPLFSH